MAQSKIRTRKSKIQKSPIPVSVLVGFLGAGKTTLLNHLLSANHGRKIAVIVNEFGEINIDSKLVRHTTEKVIQMSNGCICCTLREDLLTELTALSQTPGLEYILIESTGIGEPMPIAQTFYMGDLENLVRLDSIITVVDAVNFWDIYNSEGERLNADGEIVTEPLAPLLVDQLEFTNIVLINKTDLADPDDVTNLEAFIRQLNPDARLHRTVHGQVDPSLLIETGLYNYERGAEAENWDLEWNQPSSEVDEYGFSSFAFRSETPLDWEAFDRFLSSPIYDRVIRSKGIAFFANHNPVIISQAGGLCELEELEPLADSSPDDDETTELVFIGQGLPKAEILSALQNCQAQDVNREKAKPKPSFVLQT
ncbi:MAG: zinc metallochaperone GTPase ZigA [Anaerolineales bacterium]